MTKPLSFEDVLAILIAAFKQLPDARTSKNLRYPICGAAVRANGALDRPGRSNSAPEQQKFRTPKLCDILTIKPIGL